MRLPVMPPVAPMLAKPVGEIPPNMLYEPKWDGFRAIVFRDGNEIEIASRNARPLARYFPELVARVKENLPKRCVVDGELVIANPDTRALDFWALQQRLHPAESRIRLLADSTPAMMIVFDLLALHDTDHTKSTFRSRRHILQDAFLHSGSGIHVTPITDDHELATRWFQRFEGAGLDGLIAKDPGEIYRPDQRVMMKIKHRRSADCVVVGYRPHKTGWDTLGSMLLGLYQDDHAPSGDWTQMFGGLLPVGSIGAFPMQQRRQLTSQLEPFVVDIEEHPWRDASREMATSRRGTASRWKPERHLEFVPLNPELVVEVRYDSLDGIRFRHPAQFQRWRPDRDPTSCGYAQLELPNNIPVDDILSAPRGMRGVSPR